MDPFVTPLLAGLLGNLARELIADACKDHLKDKLKSLFGWLEKLGERDKVERAYQDAFEQAYSVCLEMLLQNIKGCGYTNEELQQYRDSFEAFIKDKEVATELFECVRNPALPERPAPDLLLRRWNAAADRTLPDDAIWKQVSIAFRRQAEKRVILSPELREILNAQNLAALRAMIDRQGGVKIPVQFDRYAQRMRGKYSPVDLANLMPAYADDPGRMVIRDVFVPQRVRENPPPVEIPKELYDRLKKQDRQDSGANAEEVEDEKAKSDERQFERLRSAYVSQSPRSVLDVIAAPANRLLVLTGEPGSGKSTLLRYLLTGVLEPPLDRASGRPLPWTEPFKNAFPLFIELRDFHALRTRNECDCFLEYVDYMGKSDQWFLDQHAVNDFLTNGPALVMFDGLDEIFDSGDRERVMHEIAGFAQRYPRARFIVTSRPVGYKDRILRDAGFTHFGLQDLDDPQVETFIRGWFALTFPQQPQQAQQRIDRVLGSVRQSKPIRMLAGNPMLLTIMALLAREQELPRERAKFYEKAVEVLCHHWDVNRNLELPLDRYLNADDKKALLRRIAMRMQTGDGGLKGNAIAEDDLEREIQAYLLDNQWQPNAAEAKKAARRIIHQLHERNYVLCLRGPSLYGFVHRTFLEYLTAAEYVERFNKQPQKMNFEQLLALFDQHCHDAEWREVLRLICGQINEEYVGRIVEHLATRTDMAKWNGMTPLPELPLAIGCLSELRGVAKMDHAGDILLATIISMFRAKRVGLDKPYWQELIDSAEELGVRWPGKRESPYQLNMPSYVDWYHVYWPKMIATIFNVRSQILALADSGHYAIRWGALEVLAHVWPDDQTRQFLTERAIQDKEGAPRLIALQTLADKWPDNQTRNFLTERAVRDEGGYPRRAALQAVAEKWPDNQTRKFLTERAIQDENDCSRSAAFQALAEKWPDDQTRKFLIERAVHDKQECARSAALQAIAKMWPDDHTRDFLIERTRFDGCAAHLHAQQHSQFGRILFSEHFNGYYPYLDPTQPVARDHIERVAKEAGVPTDQIDATVRSLSEHMGWDITKGSASDPPSEPR